MGDLVGVPPGAKAVGGVEEDPGGGHQRPVGGDLPQRVEEKGGQVKQPPLFLPPGGEILPPHASDAHKIPQAGLPQQLGQGELRLHGLAGQGGL